MARGRRRSGLLGLSMVAGVLIACGSDGGTGGPDTTVSVVETSAVTGGSGAVDVVAPRKTRCDTDQQPVVTAFAVDSGAVRWILCSAESGSWWLAGASDDLVYATVTESTSSLVALDTATGEEQWRTSLGSANFRLPSGPFLGSDVAVVVLTGGSETAQVVGLDPTTGQEIWATTGTNGGYATSEDVVIGGGSTITAYSRETGEQRWSVVPRGGYSGYSDPVISDGMVVIATDPGAVALDLDSGAERWRTTTSPQGVPGVVEDRILVWSGQDDPTSGVDMATGEILWTQPGHSSYDNVFAIGDGAVYVFALGEGGTGESTATAYEVATGETRWSHGLGPQFGPWPFVANDVYVVAVDPNVLVLSTDDGSELWRTPSRARPSGMSVP